MPRISPHSQIRRNPLPHPCRRPARLSRARIRSGHHARSSRRSRRRRRRRLLLLRLQRRHRHGLLPARAGRNRSRARRHPFQVAAPSSSGSAASSGRKSNTSRPTALSSARSRRTSIRSIRSRPSARPPRPSAIATSLSSRAPSTNRSCACRPPSCPTCRACSGSIRWVYLLFWVYDRSPRQARTAIALRQNPGHDAARAQARAGSALQAALPACRRVAQSHLRRGVTDESPPSAHRHARRQRPGGPHAGALFQERGHHVTVLTRGPYTAPWQTVHWDGIQLGPWVETLEGADVCINLSGRSVNCRYTAAIAASSTIRASGRRACSIKAFATLANPPRLWMNASTATIYRHSLDRDMDEATGETRRQRDVISARRPRAPEKWNWTISAGERLGVCVLLRSKRRARARSRCAPRWSSAPHPAASSLCFSRLVRFGLGGTQGNGRQYVSWIHEADFARAIEFLIDHEEIDGPVNLAAPNPLPNREFMAALREAWDVPNGLPAPAPLIDHRHVLSAQRARAGPQEPPRRSRPPARSRISV